MDQRLDSCNGTETPAIYIDSSFTMWGTKGGPLITNINPIYNDPFSPERWCGQNCSYTDIITLYPSSGINAASATRTRSNITVVVNPTGFPITTKQTLSHLHLFHRVSGDVHECRGKRHLWGDDLAAAYQSRNADLHALTKFAFWSLCASEHERGC